VRKPRFRNAKVGVRGVEGYENQVYGGESQAEGTDNPSDPRSGVSPTDHSSSVFFGFSFHNSSLQHYHLQSVTATVTTLDISAEPPKIHRPRS
jgi:hypothetical protein